LFPDRIPAIAKLISYFVSPNFHQYLQKRLSWFGDTEGGRKRSAQRRSFSKAGAALAQIRSPAAEEQRIKFDIKESFAKNEKAKLKSSCPYHIHASKFCAIVCQLFIQVLVQKN
jgi:hypothetical protein